MTVIVSGLDDDGKVQDEAQKSSELEDEADAVLQPAFAPVAQTQGFPCLHFMDTFEES